MASYTDRNSSLSSYVPYIQQLPIEAMTQVGIQKQAQYDQGVQRIQSSIDRVAGLNIMRDVDKQYLHSKMNQLGIGLKGVSMGDFSNYQLVNSVGGMVNQIGNDKFVQSAVYSTAKIQKELENIDTLRKAGKSDKNNEDYFYEKMLNPYLQAGLKDESGKPISFNGSFSPYVDVSGEIAKLVKDAGMDKSILQQMYVTDGDGKIQFDSHGRALPARTMTEVTTESNARAVNAIVNSVLDRGDVQNQIGIDSWANSRGLDANTMLAGYQKEYNDNFSSIDEQTIKLKTLLAGKVNDEQKKYLEDNIKQLADTRSKYKDQLKDLVSLAQTNPEAFKERMYRYNYENGLRDSFIKRTREEKNLDNPYTKQLNWEQDFRLKNEIERGNLAVAQGNLKVNQDRLNAEWPIDPITGKRVKADGKTKPGGGNPAFSADNPGKESTTASQQNVDDINSLTQKSDEVGMSILHEMYNRSPNPNNHMTDEAFKKFIEGQAKTNGMSSQDYVYTFLKNSDDAAKELAITLQSRDRDALKAYTNLRDERTGRIAVTKTIDDKLQKKYNIDPKKLENDVIPASVKLDDGSVLSYSRQDMINASLYNLDPTVKSEVDKQYGNVDGLYRHIIGVLRKKYGADNQPILSDEYGRPLQTADVFRVENTPEWQSLANLQKSKNLKVYKELSDEKEKILQGFIRTDDNISIPAGLDTKDAEEGRALLRTFVQGATLTGANYDQNTVADALSHNESGVSYTIHKPFVEGMPFTAVAHVTYNKKTYNINIEKQSDLENLTGKEFKGYDFNYYQAFAQTSGTYSTTTTDPGNDDAWKASIIHSDVFTGLQDSKKYIPLGAVLTLSYDEKTWIPTIYLKDRKTDEVKRIEMKGSWVIGSEGQIFAEIGNLNEPMIDRILENRQK